MRSIFEIRLKITAYKRLIKEFKDDFKNNGEVANLTLANTFRNKVRVLEWVLEDV